jgi:ABC-2 type transport system ATP-binding protein
VSDAPIQSAIAFHDVSVRYGDRQVLTHVSVAFARGATGVLGPNGAGKSTLLLAALGFVTPGHGRIEVRGECVTASRTIRSRIGYMPERDAFFPGLNLIASLVYSAELTGLPRGDAIQRAHDVLWYVGLSGAGFRRPEALSKGMRQRLKLAHALVHGPDLLLLDEPTDGMDPKGRDEMLALVRDLSHQRGVDVILASHVLPDVERTCDSVVVLREGAVVHAGRLRETPRGPGPCSFDVRIKGDQSAFIAAIAHAHIRCVSSEDATFVLRTEDARPQAIFEAAARAGVQIRHLRGKERQLADLIEGV